MLPQEFDKDQAVQGILDFEQGSMDGFANWQRQEQQRLAQLRTASGLPIGRRVRLKLRNIDAELVGQLAVVGQPAATAKLGAWRLVLADVEFSPAEIEHCLVVESTPTAT